MSRERILELEARPSTSPDQIFTIFHAALNSDTEKGRTRPNIDELSADGLLLLMAGTDTTAHVLTVATYNALREPRVLGKLQAELREAIPNKDMWIKSAELEKLSYLRSVIKESLRISSGTPGRLPRVVPSTGAVLCGQRIAPGVSACSFQSTSRTLQSNIFRPLRP